MGGLIYLATVLVGVALSQTAEAVSATPTVVARKCTSNDPREKLYPECMQSESLVLWCDYSSYTSVPDPDTIYKSKSCNDSISLYLNDSCLPALHRHEIGKYPHIEDLHCGQNFIKVIERYLFYDNKKLRTLNMGDNEIHTVHDRAFFGLNKLEILDLTNNRISNIGRNMFLRLPSLKELHLQGNQIQVLAPYTFNYVPQLEVLVLTGNKISHVNKLAFYGLKNLVRLHLDGNELSSLDAATFQKTPKLKVLTLSYNKFIAAPRFLEKSLVNLQTLNLGHNFLRELEMSMIANLSKLQTLSLENNSIPVVSHDSFEHMPSLRFLNLSSNGIEEVSQCSFSKTWHLEVLNLSNNTLRTPHPEWFTALIRNKAVGGTDISGNQWKCDCKAIRYYEFLTELPASWKNELFITCDWPKEHFGKNLSDVIHSLKNDPKCAHEPYNKIERSCNSSMALPQKATEVYTHLPTTTVEDESKFTPYFYEDYEIPEAGDKIAKFEAQFADKEDPKETNESLNLYLLIALCAACVIVAALLISVVKIVRRNGISEDNKSGSTEKMLLPSPPSSRSDSESSYETKRVNSTATVMTVVSATNISDLASGEITPFQPQGDLKNGSRSSSDSGINSYPSSLTPSEVTLSEPSTYTSDRSMLQVINENEVITRPRGETTPKKVLGPNQDSSEDDDEDYLTLPQREQPIGGNSDDEFC